jgi:SPP1 family predicted phage head-tail adaptor
LIKDTVKIQRLTIEDNGMGGVTEEWNDHLTIMGIVDYISGQEALIGGQFADRATHILVCEAGLDITNKDRAVYRGGTYHILHVDNPFDRHGEILLEYVEPDQEAVEDEIPEQ